MTPSILNVNSVATMSSREIAELVDSRHDKVKQSIERLVERGVIVQPPLGDEQFTDTLGRPRTEQVYRVSKRDSYIVVAQLCPEFTARLVDRWQELETKQATPAIDTDEGKLLLIQELATKQLALIHENRQIAIERDHAIATKAQIGSKREATALANTAKANREAAKLRDQLGFSARHATILQVEDAMQGDFNFLPLRNWCKANEVIPATVPDKRYPKGVKAWPAGAWGAVYGVRLDKLFGEVAA